MSVINPEITVPILLNTNNFVQNSKSTYRYNFPGVGLRLEQGDKLALSSMFLYYSWFSITEDYGNNKFTIIINSTSYNAVIPDGYYSIEDLEKYIQHFCIQNGLYLRNSNNEYVYYISLSNNPTRYRFQLHLTVLPTSLPTGWSEDPINPFPFPATSVTMQLEINDLFGKIIGFTAGTYPSSLQTSDYSVLGNKAPIVNPVQSVLVRCHMISNGQFSNPTDLLDIFTVSKVNYGGIIKHEPSDSKYNSITPGKYNFIQIELVDQNLNPIKLEDIEISILLILKINH